MIYLHQSDHRFPHLMNLWEHLNGHKLLIENPTPLYPLILFHLLAPKICFHNVGHKLLIMVTADPTILIISTFFIFWPLKILLSNFDSLCLNMLAPKLWLYNFDLEIWLQNVGPQNYGLKLSHIWILKFLLFHFQSI